MIDRDGMRACDTCGTQEGPFKTYGPHWDVEIRLREGERVAMPEFVVKEVA